MRYNLLGRTGLFVSEICLGTMTFGEGGDIYSGIGGVQQNDADDLVRTAIDAGINFIDTANVYAQGQSEQTVGQALRNLGIARSEVIVATKFFGPTGVGQNSTGVLPITEWVTARLVLRTHSTKPLRGSGAGGEVARLR